MRIVHVIQGLSPGGAERVVVDLVTEMSPTDELLVVCQGRPLGPTYEQISGAVRYLTQSQETGLSRSATLLALGSILRDLRPDIVHTHTFFGSIYGRVAALLRGFHPLVHTEHGANAPVGHYGFSERILPIIGRRTDATLVLSQQDRDVVVGRGWAPLSRTWVVPNGVPSLDFAESETQRLRSSLGVAGGRPLVLAVGLSRQEKRLDRFLEVAHWVAKRYSSPLTFAIVGSGAELLIQPRGRPENLRLEFLGRLPDARPFIAAADVVLNTSDWEGMPMALLEAMSIGVPFVAPSIGSIPELVKAGGGFATDASVEALGRKVELLLLDSSLRRRMGREGRSAARTHYSIHKMALATREAYIKAGARQGETD